MTSNGPPASAGASSTAPRKPERRDTNSKSSARVIGTDSPLGKHIKNLEHNFNIETFIGDLTETVIEESKSKSGAIDPLPYTKTFSPALDHLLALQKQVAAKTRRLEEEMKIAERDYAGRLREMHGDFNAVGTSFASLEGKITGVGRTATRIGEQLETLHHFRSLAQSVSLLLSYYLSIGQPPTPDPSSNQQNGGTETPPTTPLEALFTTRSTREGRAKLAVILRRLTTLAKDVAENAAAANSVESQGDGDAREEETVAKADLEKAERIREEVSRFAEQFEKECLRLFDKSYRKGDIKMMAHCARTLQSFNGGTSCMQMYVNQHDFFISQDRFLQESEQVMGYQVDNENGPSKDDERADLWKSLKDPSVPAPSREPGLEALFDEIRVTVGQEAQIISAVFPDKEEVLKVFLQRVFAQVIQQHLEHLFSKASALGDLALLRMLRLTNVKCAALVEDLKRYDLSSGGSPVSAANEEDKTAASSSPFAAMLDLAMEEMFMTYLDAGRYLELETRWLTGSYKEMLGGFERYHLNIIKSKPHSLLDRVVNQLSSSSSAPANPHLQASGGTGAASTAAAWLHKYGGVASSFGASAGAGAGAALVSGRASPAPSGAATPRMEDSAASELAAKPRVNEAEAALETLMAERMLKTHAEAVGRVVELSLPGDVPKNTNIIAHILMDSIGRNYMELALDSLIARLDVFDGKTEPPITGLLALKQVDSILHLWQRYSATAILPLTATSVTVRKQYSQANAGATTRVEGKANSLIQKTIDAVMVWLANTLKKQKNNDFKPKDEEMSFARMSTEPCQNCCEFLEKLKSLADRSVSGKNAKSFLSEVGMVFHALLLEHFKKFPVNPTGGLMLTKDLAAYQDVIKTFGIPELNERFEMLRQLGNSFIVQPDVLRSYLSEAHLGKVDARLLRPYLAQRSDYSSFSRRFLEDEGLPVPDVPTDDGSNHGLSRGSRLSIGAGSGMSRLRELLKAVDEHAFGHERRSEKHDSFSTAAKDVTQINSSENNASKTTRFSHQPQPKHGVVLPVAY